MKRLDRYVLAAFGRAFFLSLAAFAALYLLIDVFERIDNFIANEARPIHFLLYFGSKLPLIVTQILPLAIIMGVFMTLGGLSRHNELTAMRSGGISLWRIVAPLVLVAAAAAVFLLLAGEFLVPVSARSVHHIYEVQVKGKPGTLQKREDVWFREGNVIVHVVLAEPEENRLEGITLFRTDADFRVQARTDAREAVYRGEGWQLQDATVRRFAPGTSDLSDLEYLPVLAAEFSKPPEEFAVPPEKNLEMGIRELRRMIDRLQAEGYDASRYRVDLQARLATPFSCIILAFLGIPFALQSGRSAGPALGVAISICVGIAYFITQALLQAFGYSAVLPPVLAAWSPNILFGLLAIWLLLSTRNA